MATPKPLIEKTLDNDSQQASVVLSVVQADITTLEVDAIVNAANSSLLGGDGVDGAIHRAAGRELVEYCRTLKGCKTGDAKISPAFKLPSHYVIHTVGPVWHGGQRGEPEDLANCYKRSLELAQENKLTSIAFSAISTGVYGYPIEKAAQIAIDTVSAFVTHRAHDDESLMISKVIFCCYSASDAAVYERLLQQG